MRTMDSHIQDYGSLAQAGQWKQEGKEMLTLRRKQEASTALQNVLFINQRRLHSGFLITGVVLDILYCTIKIKLIAD